MVYPGRPSRGCYQCRRRKIGCDQTRPQCQRCVSSNRQCPGYRDEIDVVLRSENEKTKQRVLTRQSRRDATSATGSGETSDLPTTSMSVEEEAASPQRALSIPPTLGPNWEDQLVCYLFNQWVMQAGGLGQPGWLEFLPDLYQQSSDASCVQSSVAAVAFANLANQSSIPWISMQARHCYEEALRSVNSALRGPEHATTDKTLTGVFLLGLFENINGEKRAILGNHGEGLSSLIRMRGEIHTERSRGLLRVIHSLMQGRTLGLRQHPLPASVEWWNKVPKFAPGARLGAGFMNICRICATADDIKASTDDPDSRQRMLDVMREAEDVDNEMQSWSSIATPWRLYRDIREIPGLGIGNPSLGGKPSETIHIYQDIWSASVWNFYRTGRIALHAALLECADFLDITEWVWT